MKIEERICIWPTCGAKDCADLATVVDEDGVGWCDVHEDLALSMCERADSIDVFDAEWLWEQQAEVPDVP